MLVVTGSTPGRVAPLIHVLRAGAQELSVLPIGGEPTVSDARAAVAAGRSWRPTWSSRSVAAA